MGKTARKLNFLIEESICRELERISRKDVVDKILSTGTKGKKFSNRQIIETLSKDRGVY